MYPVHTILSLSGAHLPVLPLPPLSQLLQTLPSNSPLSYHSPCTHMGIEEEYLLSLLDRKQPKALISQSLFDKIYAALQNGSEDRGSTAQFRFWVRKIGLCNAPFALLLGPQGTYGQVCKGLSYLHPQAKREPGPPLAVQLCRAAAVIPPVRARSCAGACVAQQRRTERLVFRTKLC